MSEENREELILRDYLAIDRTKLANQRTLLAYIRTSLILMGTGVTLLQIMSLKDVLFYLGIGSIAGSLIFLIIGILIYRSVAKNIATLYRFNKFPV